MDLYALLGVTRAASTAEIERAYRRLARLYHPGINPGDRAAEELFRQVQHAFGVLGDTDRRRDYDRGAAPSPAPAAAVVATVSLEGFDFTAPADGPQAATFSELFADVFQDAAREATTPTRGGDIELTLAVSFRDAALGSVYPQSIVRRDRCTACAGDGRTSRHPAVCAACGGAGARRWARGHMVFARTCDECGGAGQLTSQACRTCAGVGLQSRSEVVTIPVPAGVGHGDRIAIPGRGHAGARGGPAGDLYVTVDVQPHPYFRREGRDLHLTLPVAVHEAALGARVDVPTLDGQVRLRIPAGTPSGRKFRIEGAGLAPGPAQSGDAGDLVVEIQIVLPAIKDERSRQLLREFGEINSQNVREFLFQPGKPGE